MPLTKKQLEDVGLTLEALKEIPDLLDKLKELNPKREHSLEAVKQLVSDALEVRITKDSSAVEFHRFFDQTEEINKVFKHELDMYQLYKKHAAAKAEMEAKGVDPSALKPRDIGIDELMKDLKARRTEISHELYGKLKKNVEHVLSQNPSALHGALPFEPDRRVASVAKDSSKYKK